MAVDNIADLDELNRKVAESEADDDVGEELDIVTLLVVARKSLIWVILLILWGLTASFLFIRYNKPVYLSTSTIKIDEQSQAGDLGLGTALGEAASAKKDMVSLSGEVELIKSDIIYKELKRKLNLTVNYYAMGNVLNEELYNNSPFKIDYTIRDENFYNKQFNVTFLTENLYRLSFLIGDKEISGEYKIGAPIDKKEISFILTKTKNFSQEVFDQKYHFIINNDNALSNYFNSNLEVQIINPDAHTIDISFKDNNPVKARDIVTYIDSAYLDQKINKKNQATRQTQKFLSDQLNETKKNLQEAENSIEAFVRQNKTYNVKADVETQMGKLEELATARLELQLKLSTLDDLARLIAQNGNLEQIIPNLKIENAELTSKISDLSDLQLQLKLIRESYTEQSTAVQLKREELKFYQNGVNKLISQSREELRKELATINNTISAIEGRLNTMPGKETELARQQRSYDLYEKYFQTLSEKQVEYGIAEAGTIPDFQILQPASLPNSPIYPNKLLVYALGLAGGLLLGVSLIATRYFMHNTVTTLGEVERKTRASVLGVVPRYTKEKLLVSKLIVDKNPKSAISESIRSIRTNLEFISSSKKKRLISITSTVSGEGKTFVAVNLGGIIALSEQKVIILDLDLRKPKVNIAFDAENSIGISTILIEKHSVEECIQKTSIENLDFISAGPTPPNPSELILNPKFDEMLEELHQLYDVIIVDTPPIGLVTDGILVMRKADIPIYIVRADYSKKAFLKNINKVMKTNNFNNLTVILNDAKGMGAYGYGYGYGYVYGNSYYEEEVKESFFTRLKKNFT